MSLRKMDISKETMDWVAHQFFVAITVHVALIVFVVRLIQIVDIREAWEHAFGHGK